MRKLQVRDDGDDVLLQGCIRGDRISQNRLYEKYSSKMFAVCYRYSRSREDAEDTFHEGFMKVFDNIGNFKGEGSFEGWIRRIMVNTAINKYKKNTNLYALLPLNNLRVDHFGSEEILSHIGTKELISMIRDLPPRYQMVFNLYVFEGMKHREIAAHMDITEGTSKSNLSDARRILQNAVARSLRIALPPLEVSTP